MSSVTLKSIGHDVDVTASNWNVWGSKLQRVSMALTQPITLDTETARNNPYDRESQDNNIKPTLWNRWVLERLMSSSEKGTGTEISSSPSKRPTHYKKDSRIQSLTQLLMIASAVYVALNVPYWVYHVIYRPWKIEGTPGCAYRHFVHHMLLLLRYSNHSLNFFFYVATGNRFRQEFYNWVRYMRRN